ncbi:hypothetical protein HanRHA438_Chr02g0068251 [Helianthus annuus]|nr:hypothetical protein HanRHA438_Chr02g0068251 [Helianthus annuus]
MKPAVQAKAQRKVTFVNISKKETNEIFFIIWVVFLCDLNTRRITLNPCVLVSESVFHLRLEISSEIIHLHSRSLSFICDTLKFIRDASEVIRHFVRHH